MVRYESKEHKKQEKVKNYFKWLPAYVWTNERMNVTYNIKTINDTALSARRENYLKKQKKKRKKMSM